MKLYQIYALISMLFAGLTSVMAKAGLKNVSSDIGLTVRTTVVFGIVGLNVLLFQPLKEFNQLTSKDVIFLAISGFTTSISWIFYYKAIKMGNVSEVALIDKGSIIITMLLSIFLLQEQFTWKMAAGSALIISGLLVLTLK
ncbi:MAG: EamA family transporter [Chitinophagia bacterium]|nr:EamA family transporter [Chitinophagia bacterium]